MAVTIKPYLQLVRLPNVLTAAADSLAGWLLVGGSLAEPGRWLPLVAASMVLYAVGHGAQRRVRPRDRPGRTPGRPLPSGRVSRPVRGLARRDWCCARAGAGAGWRFVRPASVVAVVLSPASWPTTPG